MRIMFKTIARFLGKMILGILEAYQVIVCLTFFRLLPRGLRLFEWFCGVAFSVAVLALIDVIGGPGVTLVENIKLPVMVFLFYGVFFFASRLGKHYISRTEKENAIRSINHQASLRMSS